MLSYWKLFAKSDDSCDTSQDKSRQCRNFNRTSNSGPLIRVRVECNFLACFLISKSDGLSIRLSRHSPSVANFTSRINTSSQVRISQCWYFRTREVPTPDSQPGWDMTGQDCHDNGLPWPIYHGSGTWRQDRMGNGTWRDMAGHDECKKLQQSPGGRVGVDQQTGKAAYGNKPASAGLFHSFGIPL